MNRQELLTKLYKHIIKKNQDDPSISIVTNDIQISSVGQLLDMLNNEFSEDKQSDVISYALGKIASPVIMQSLPFDGVCEIKCQSCKLVPIRHLIFRQCGHVFCFWCTVKYMTLQNGQMQCSKCNQYSTDLFWSQQILDKVEEAKNIICYHCNAKFTFYSDFKQHIYEQEKYFNMEQSKSISEQYQTQEKYRNERKMLMKKDKSPDKPKEKRSCSSCCCFYLFILSIILTVVTVILASQIPYINSLVYTSIDVLKNAKDIQYVKDMYQQLMNKSINSIG